MSILYEEGLPAANNLNIPEAVDPGIEAPPKSGYSYIVEMPPPPPPGPKALPEPVPAAVVEVDPEFVPEAIVEAVLETVPEAVHEAVVAEQKTAKKDKPQDSGDNTVSV